MDHSQQQPQPDQFDPIQDQRLIHGVDQRQPIDAQMADIKKTHSRNARYYFCKLEYNEINKASKLKIC